MARTGEEDKQVPLRTDRFFAVNSSWYFVTREGISIGPFLTKTDAMNALADFIDFVKIAGPELLNQFFPNLLPDPGTVHHK